MGPIGGFQRALVVLDPSTHVAWVVPWFRRLVISGGEVHLLAVLAPARASDLDGHGPRAGRSTPGERVTALATLGTLAGRLRVDGVSGTGHVRFGEPVGTILDTADDVNADVICLTIAEGRTSSGKTTAPLETLHSPVIIR